MSHRKGPNQYCFLEAQADLTVLREREISLARSADAPNTVKAYASCWKMFTRWCREWRRSEPLPASSQLVREFITWAFELRKPAYKPETIQLAVSAIKRAHRDASLPSPFDDEARTVLIGIIRQAARRGSRSESSGKKHLTVKQLRAICQRLGDEPIELRDRAIILLGFASALRRSDLGRLTSSNTHAENDGRVRLWIPYSKTDQRGTGRDIYLSPAQDTSLCPIDALEKWQQAKRAHFGHCYGPLFLRFWRTPNRTEMSPHALSAQGIAMVLKKRLEASGENSRDYAAHSMRSGMITAAHEAGANVRSIMDHTGHRNVQTVMRYAKSVRGSNPLEGVL